MNKHPPAKEEGEKDCERIGREVGRMASELLANTLGQSAVAVLDSYMKGRFGAGIEEIAFMPEQVFEGISQIVQGSTPIIGKVIISSCYGRYGLPPPQDDSSDPAGAIRRLMRTLGCEGSQAIKS